MLLNMVILRIVPLIIENDSQCHNISLVMCNFSILFQKILYTVTYTGVHIHY